ncbi:sensor histidine kinase [uncultured Schumannella sp.]|uniref:sensor histidine kinase n=1 Tax=uncultured Schumannella sp. TaxID=1195956 RepID=UPI0025D549A4|nr:ATP-binding protein [uncultured Schumannella sp.]
MDLITRDRDRLLQRAARVYGLSFTVVSALCLAVPGVVSPTTLAWSAPLYLLLAIAQWRLGVSDAIGWVLLSLVAGTAILVVVVTLDSATGAAALPALLHISAASLASVGLVLTRSAHRIALLVLSFLLITVTTVLLTATYQEPLRTAIVLLLGWILAAIIGVWIGASVPQVAKRIASIGRAHRAERQASELEAQRRQSARLLHDTVLATLTLLAHSGVGVSTDALRAQAADDARLLRQLRLGTVGGTAEQASSPVATDETVLGTTLESVKQRFGRIGLEVSWHGTGQVLLPSDVLDAFLLALAECLENVRRHSGVTQAHVTITEDTTTVRALVTDSGVGFDIADIDEAKLGFTESVVARLRDVGGNARLFSAPGAGTTVALEVPR